MQRVRLFNAVFSTLLTALVFAGSTATAVAGAINIVPGYDLLRTQTAYFNYDDGIHLPVLIPFEGVALNNYDFGGVIGSQYVGATDTIIQRTTGGTLTPNGTLTSPIVVTALNLKSQVEVGGQYIYATAGATLSGTIDIKGDKTWTNDFTFEVQLHMGSFTASVFDTVVKHFKGHGTWGTTPPNGVPVIAGVNDDSFYIHGPAVHDAGDGSQHTISVPEPSSMALLSIGGLAGFVRMRRSRATKQK
jgi:hypothetical protein